ncbi:hypothetical protein NDU88_003051 [Pleurodeles waltl]|uniref:Uncharacterized protein n=1 Tax=Pleurodeles waltl TaxID=8319 RepID=A0AAV7M2D0_PLEWA|nr:hypothetical protein NDU88_003051 [Pleurodeles waltl]
MGCVRVSPQEQDASEWKSPRGTNVEITSVRIQDHVDIGEEKVKTTERGEEEVRTNRKEKEGDKWEEEEKTEGLKEREVEKELGRKTESQKEREVEPGRKTDSPKEHGAERELGRKTESRRSVERRETCGEMRKCMGDVKGPAAYQEGHS